MEDREIDSALVLYAIPDERFFSQSEGIGGHVTHAIGGVYGLTSLGNRVVAIVSRPSEEFRAECAHIVEVNYSSATRWFRNISYARRLCTAVAEWKPKFVYLRYSGRFAPWLSVLRWCIGSTPIILEVNSLLSQRYYLYRFIDYLALRGVAAITTISELERDTILRCAGEEIKDRVFVVPNAVNLSRFTRLHRGKKPERGETSPVTIGYIGIYKPDYGLEDLIDAFASLVVHRSDVRLVLYGAGPHKEVLREKVDSIPKVGLYGKLAVKDVPAAMQALDIAIYPGTGAHGYQSPVKLFEYMAAGCAIVSCATRSTRAILEEGKLGLLYEPGDIKGLCTSLNFLITNPESRTRLAFRAQRAAFKKHSWEQRFDFLFKALLAKGLV